MTQRLRIGVIGAGARGETFARQLYAGTPVAELFGICDLDEQRLNEFCAFCQLTNARKFTDPEGFLSSKDLDAVIITTPEFTHADVAVMAMEKGKHVYLEKPLAHTLADCQRIIETQRRTGKVAYVGFNLRASPTRQKLHEIVQSGALGQVLNIEGLEQLTKAHGASFMRRFHRKSSQSGGLLNHKCCHDLDIMLWVIGHQHRVTRIASFGGTNIFTPARKPAERCSECPSHIYRECDYKFVGGFVFPVHSNPILHPKQGVYGGDLCVYNEDKDLVDNQNVLLEWDNGIRGSFNLQMFQSHSVRATRVWGERGYAEVDSLKGEKVWFRNARTGDTASYEFAKREGGHGGTDPEMIERFANAIATGDAGDSGLTAGLAASIVAIKADEARLTGKVLTISPDEYLD